MEAQRNSQARTSHPSFCLAGKGWVFYSDCCGRTLSEKGLSQGQEPPCEREMELESAGPGPERGKPAKKPGAGLQGPKGTCSPGSLPPSCSQTDFTPSLTPRPSFYLSQYAGSVPCLWPVGTTWAGAHPPTSTQIPLPPATCLPGGGGLSPRCDPWVFLKHFI